MRIRLKSADVLLNCGSRATVLAANDGAVMLHVRHEVADHIGHRMFLTVEEARDLGHMLTQCAECAQHEKDSARWRGTN